jgi:hypothetical protein
MPTYALAFDVAPIDMTPDQVTWSQTWIATGFADELTAFRYAWWNTPRELGPARLSKLRIGSRLGMTSWALEASYSTKRETAINQGATEGGTYDPVPDGYVIEYAIGAENRNIRKSLLTQVYHDAGDYTDPQGLIGLDKDGVHGVDIAYGLVSFSVTKQFQRQDITPELREKWEELSDPQHVNDDTFGGYPAGEVLFVGISNCRVTGSPTNLIPVTFSFERRRNQTAVEFGPDITIDEIKGWQVVEPRYVEKEDSTNHVMTREIKSVAIHDVFPEADFSELECGL